jgi:hypothetical protein
MAGELSALVTVAEGSVCPGCPLLDGGGDAFVLAADVDGDGTSDLIVNAETTWVSMTLIADPRGVWIEATPTFTGDFNEDDVDDLVTQNGQAVALLLSTP